MRHYARRTDANQAAIVAVWRKMGKLWVDTGRQGDGCVDGFLLHWGIWLAVEIKNPKGFNTVTAKQHTLHKAIKDNGGKIYIIRTLQEALDLVGRGLDSVNVPQSTCAGV